MNPLIQQYINYYQGRWSQDDGIRTAPSGRYMKIAREAFREEGVPVDITWLGQVESAWSPKRTFVGSSFGLVAVHPQHWRCSMVCARLPGSMSATVSKSRPPLQRDT